MIGYLISKFQFGSSTTDDTYNSAPRNVHGSAPSDPSWESLSCKCVFHRNQGTFIMLGSTILEMDHRDTICWLVYLVH